MNDNIIIQLESLLGASKKSSKNERLFFCPFCNHRKPKLSINFGPKFGFWHCWVCNARGKKIVSLLHKMNVPREQIRSITNESYSYGFEESETSIQTHAALPIEYEPLWKVNTNSYEYRNAISFIRKRNLGKIDIYRYQIGYCESGKYSGNIIIPSYDSSCKLNYFVARSYYDNSEIKYKNPSVSKNVIIFENLINWNFPVVLVEGVFDAMSVRRNSTPLLGKTMSDVLQRKLIKHKPPIVYVMLDNDAKDSALKIENFLKNENLNVKLVLTNEKDASDMGFVSSWEHINEAKPSTFTDLVECRLYD